MSDKDEIMEITGSDEQCSSNQYRPDSSMICESVVDNNAGQSQSTTEEQSCPDKDNSGHDEPSDSAIIEISDEESNASSGPSNAALPAERKRLYSARMTVYKLRFNIVGLDSSVTDQISNRITPNDDDNGRAEQSSSTSRVPDSNMIEPLVDNSAGPSQSTTEEQSGQSGNTGHDEPSDSAIIEISDEESNGPSNAALHSERKRKIGGVMTLYKLRFKLIPPDSTVTDQTVSTINNNDENREDTGRAGQHTSPASVSDPNVTRQSNENIRRLTEQINKARCWLTNRPLPNNINSGQNQRSDSTIIEISDEESNASAAGPSSRASTNAQRPIDNTMNNDEMTLYSYTLKLMLARKNMCFFTDESTYRLSNRNEESEEETEEAALIPNVISQAVINKLIDSCDGLSQSDIRTETEPDNSQGPPSDTNVIEISDDETSSGPSGMAPPNASQTIEKGNSSYENKFKQKKEDSEQDDDDQA